MTKRSFQTLMDINAHCTFCDARCDARNAQAWAHQHAKMTGHVVYFSPVFKVESAQRPLFDFAPVAAAK